MGGFENEARNIGGLTEENYGYIRAAVKCEEQQHVRHFPKKFSEVGITSGKKRQAINANLPDMHSTLMLQSRLAYALPLMSTSWFLSSLEG
jgi:hypothetical protein